MAEGTSIFSESWHRIAGLRLSPRSALQIRKQYFRGERWYVLQDSFDNSFYRFRPAAYAFLARMSPARTMQEVWDECLAHSPESAPTQPEVIRLLTQLYQANLLQTELPPDSAQLFARTQERARTQTHAAFVNFLFLKIPLFDPDAFLRRCTGPLWFFLTPWAGLLWLMLIFAGLKVVADHAWELSGASDNVFAPDNLFLLYTTFIVTKAIHEFGHGFLCRSFGGEVHRMGLMFMIFNPMPFVDATSSWAFQSRWRRILVASGGMIFELAFAACMVFVWANTAPGALHRFAENSMFIASVSTVLFNINPLIRFDGYYILSDALDVPNLATRSMQEVRFAFERWICGIPRATSVAASTRERAWLIAYGLAGGLYRVVLAATIALYLGDRFFELGLLLAVFYFVSGVLFPLGKFCSYLLHSPSLARSRTRAWGAAAAAGVLLVIGVGLVPVPHAFRAPGVLEAEHYTKLFAPTEGFVERVVATSGEPVAAQAPLLRLHHAELKLDLEQVEAQRRGMLAQIDSALASSPGALEPLDRRLEALEKRLAQLRQQETQLTVVATQGGVWVAPDSGDWLGSWVERGTPLGELIDPSAFRFSAVVSQAEASSLFTQKIRRAEIRLVGQGGVSIPVKVQRIVPAHQDELPSAALGWKGGGEVAVEKRDPSGRRTAESFFQVFATVEPTTVGPLWQHRSGQIRFELPPQPLVQQWYRSLLRLIQTRYNI